jgi:hypothetical protein
VISSVVVFTTTSSTKRRTICLRSAKPAVARLVFLRWVNIATCSISCNRCCSAWAAFSTSAHSSWSLVSLARRPFQRNSISLRPTCPVCYKSSSRSFSHSRWLISRFFLANRSLTSCCWRGFFWVRRAYSWRTNSGWWSNLQGWSPTTSSSASTRTGCAAHPRPSFQRWPSWPAHR